MELDWSYVSVRCDVLLHFKIISVIEEIASVDVKMLLQTKFYPLFWLCSAIQTVESH